MMQKRVETARDRQDWSDWFDLEAVRPKYPPHPISPAAIFTVNATITVLNKKLSRP